VLEAQSEDPLTPVRVLYFIKEILINDGGEGLVKTGLKPLRSLIGDFNGSLEESQRELVVRLAGNPESELIMPQFGLLWLGFGGYDGKQVVHVSETQVTILENNPSSRDHALVHDGFGLSLLTFSHGNVFGGELLLLSGEIFDG
jgi:hypothetical protein